MDDESLLALGRAVYAFQTVEWLAMRAHMVLAGADARKTLRLTFGPLVDGLRRTLDDDPRAGYPVRDGLIEWVGSLTAVNILRQDVFHAYPNVDDELRRFRQSGQVIDIDRDVLAAAAHRFDKATEEGNKVFSLLLDARRAAAGQGGGAP
jgi:hypothetical protein